MIQKLGVGDVMNRQGYLLSKIPLFPPGVYALLRDQVSVTTAEQLLDLAGRKPQLLQQAIGTDQTGLDRLVMLARSVLSASEVREIESPERIDYPFRTGHDLPKVG